MCHKTGRYGSHKVETSASGILREISYTGNFRLITINGSEAAMDVLRLNPQPDPNERPKKEPGRVCGAPEIGRSLPAQSVLG